MSASQSHQRRTPRHRCGSLSSTLLSLGIGLGGAAAEDLPSATPVARPPAATPAGSSAQQLQERVQALEEEVRTLQAHEQQPRLGTTTPEAAPAPAANQSALVFGMYGEIAYGAVQNPAANGQWQNGFDGGRLTVLPSYQVSDAILFKAEIEFEHGGISSNADDKLTGTVGVEQAFLDISLNEHLHWRPPGIDVVPFGYTNLYHEPTLFYSVQRSDLANGLIPTTWFEGATSIHGLLAGPVSYQFQVSTSLVDDGGNVSATTPAKTPPDGGYPAGIDGRNALAFSRSTISDFAQETNQLGYALRLSYAIPSVHGLDGSTSVYFTPNVEGRGTYATTAGGIQLPNLGRCALTMADSELRYRPDQQGIELRAEVVGIQFSNPSHLRANHDADPTNNVGRTMWGVSAEIAYHLRIPRGDCDLVPFYRYSREDLQTAGFSGLDANTPDGSGQRQFHTLGIAVFPLPQVVLKVDYQIIRSEQPGGARSNHLLGGVGFFF